MISRQLRDLALFTFKSLLKSGVRLFPLLIGLLFSASVASPQLDQMMKKLGDHGSANSESKVGSGLKEALSIGTSNAVNLTGAPDGFWGNAAIKILMPEKLKPLEKGLRMAGQGPKIDEFELAMNRAAESAAPAAAPIFKKAITSMTFSDAKGILTGGHTAATDYFKRTTSADLTAAFRPEVQEAMSKVGVVQKYDSLTQQMQGFTFGKAQPFDITSYVVSKTLDGIFLMLGREEEKIRTNPAAQVTPLLKQVFGKL
jgi:hypothetical protein